MLMIRAALVPHVLFAFALSACAASDITPTDSVSEMDQTSSLVQATYSVPVAPALASAAAFPVVGGVKWKADGMRASLDYELPLGLTGSRQRVNLSGTFVAQRNAYALAGAAGTGECTVVDTTLRCTEHLPGITIDVDQAILLTPASVNASQREAVIRQFPGEPVGILTGTVRARSRGR
jgi:hypothetical protein